MNATHKFFFVVPGLSDKYRSGGLWVIKSLAAAFREYGMGEIHFITTHESDPQAFTWSSLPFEKIVDNVTPIFVVTWGPLVHEHIKSIRAHARNARILYYAQSYGWDVKVPRDIPIVCASRYVMAQWALQEHGNICAYIPPFLATCFLFGADEKRSIDILVHERKQNSYCLNHLVPALEHAKFTVELIRDWIPQEKFAHLLRQSKIFLYLTTSHRAGLFRKLKAEGFGLPALEAIASGTHVASNVLGGVTDFLTPGENCIPMCGDVAKDGLRIKRALENWQPLDTADALKEYSKENVVNRWRTIIEIL